MNLRELTEACQHAIAEVSDAFFPPEVWRGFLNAAQNEFARKTRCIERISQGRTAPGRRVYPLDLDFFHINLVRCGDRVLKPISSYDMEARVEERGHPTHFHVNAGRLFLWPTPTVQETLVVWYNASPEDMVQDEDEPEIPRVYHHVLVPGACYRALRADKDYIGATRFEEEWKEELYEAYTAMQMQEGENPIVRDVYGW